MSRNRRARSSEGRPPSRWASALSAWLHPEQILTGVEADSKAALLRTMFDVAWNSLPRLGATAPERQEIWQLLDSVESKKPSGFGRGVALPHVDVQRLTVPGICVATLTRPIDFGSLDGVPCDFVCLVLVPEDQPSRPLNVLAMLARMSSEPGFHEDLVRQTDPVRLLELLEEGAEWMHEPILARDVMRAPHVETYVDTPLSDVTLKMLRHDVDAVAVLTRERRVVGQITCDEMLLLGLPDFFRQLKSVSFIRQFDPFERYFEKHRSQCAGAVMSSSFSALDEESTLIEVVFELAVRGHPKVYVTRDARLVGVIDRFLLLDRVMNL